MTGPQVGEPEGRLQFSLWALLVGTCLVGVVLSPAHWFGGLYLLSVILSGALIVICVAAYSHRRPLVAYASMVGGIFLGFFLLTPILLFQAMLSLIVLLICRLCGLRARSLAVALTVLAVFVYGLAIMNGAGEVRRLMALQRMYPFQSLEARLAYERNAKSADASMAKTSEIVGLSNVVLANLQAQEEETLGWDYRALSLRRLHEDTYQQFALAAGFGVGRMPRVRPEYVQLEPLPVVALPLGIARVSANPQPLELEQTHLRATADFIANERLGYVRSRNAVAGFGSHGFSKLDSWTESKKDSFTWQVVRLELVSLLRHDQPRVYVAHTLPLMEQLAGLSTRPLDSFEQQALIKLQHDLDTVIDISENRITMLGAVRAGRRCLECHEGQRGTLLGAFSYELVPAVNFQSMSASVDDYSSSGATRRPW